jgi:hypothetical protein
MEKLFPEIPAFVPAQINDCRKQDCFKPDFQFKTCSKNEPGRQEFGRLHKTDVLLFLKLSPIELIL